MVKLSSARPSRSLTQNEIRRGLDRLEKAYTAMQNLDPKQIDAGDPWALLRPLTQQVTTALTETFWHESVEFYPFRLAQSFDYTLSLGNEFPHDLKIVQVSKDRLRNLHLLQAAIDLLKDRLVDSHDEQGSTSQMAQTHSNKIFVVHGHDQGPKEAVARFLEALGLMPIILHEQPNKGRTIIQKFQDEAADVGFAIVLVTPDDVMKDGKLRARQNVVLELGFFLGRLGPSHVAALVKDQVEKPSDFDGVVYISFDNGGWRESLARELQAAGYEIDWNKVMK